MQVTPAFVKLGVTEMVATSGSVPPFVVVKSGIVPVPLELASPIVVMSLVQA